MNTYWIIDFSTLGSYIQFRPLSYTDSTRNPSKNTGLQLNEPVFINPKSYVNSTLVWSYYGNSMDNNLVQAFNISFGEKNDKFYSKSNFTTW